MQGKLSVHLVPHMVQKLSLIPSQEVMFKMTRLCCCRLEGKLNVHLVAPLHNGLTQALLLSS